MKQTFNPKDWLPNDSRSDIDLVVSRIETSHTDITGSYADWLNLGFALADQLGEAGRDYFHRISRFYSKYSHTDCNRQFDQCLKAKGHGITIKTLFHLAKQAGVEIGGMEQGAGGMGHGARGMGQTPGSEPHALSPKPPAPSSGPEAPCPTPLELPTLPDEIFSTLPDFFQRVVEKAESKEERDILLMGA